MTDVEKAKLDPASVYSSPREVLSDSSITREDKIDILKRWEYDVREIMVAEEENMPADNSAVLLEEIIAALKELGAGPETKDFAPTKHGGV